MSLRFEIVEDPRLPGFWHWLGHGPDGLIIDVGCGRAIDAIIHAPSAWPGAECQVDACWVVGGACWFAVAAPSVAAPLRPLLAARPVDEEAVRAAMVGLWRRLSIEREDA